MPNREKVIKALELCIDEIGCRGCPYENNCFSPDGNVFGIMMRDALAILKNDQHEIWEFQDQVEYLTDKLKEQETELCDRCGRRRLKSNRVEGR